MGLFLFLKTDIKEIIMEENKKITLSVKRKVWRANDENDTEENNEEFKKNRLRALRRDGFTCAFCGFKSHTYMEVHHIDDNHTNNDMENLIAIDKLCHDAHHLGFSAKDNLTTMIYTGGLEQTELNHLFRTLMIAETVFKEEKDNVNNVYKELEKLAVILKENGGTNETQQFANALLPSVMDEDTYEKRNTTLANLALMYRSGFIQKDNIDGWLQESYSGYIENNKVWKLIYNNYFNQDQ